MTKEELFRELYAKIYSGEIKYQEVVSLFGPAVVENQTTALKENVANKLKSNFSLTKVLYGIGAVIILIGLFVLFAQIWDDIGAFGRVSVTLGVGLITALVGTYFYKVVPESNLGSVFHTIGGILIPVGSLVLLYEFKSGIDPYNPLIFTFAILTAFYALLTYIHKNPILTFFTIANSTALIYLLMFKFVDTSMACVGSVCSDLIAYLTMILGVSYLLLAYAFNKGWNEKLTGVLYFLGTAGLLGAGFYLVWETDIWKVLFFVLVLGCMASSIYLKSRSVLVVSTIFLIIHISYISGKYFADSVGWPLTLIVLGFVFVFLGYVSINISKKLIGSN